ncbi:hypothetical protein TrCOL_g3709 [Triparma columacea]|uniref:GMP phosphodiesterase delta subunit domain-containing protein n=1 Tax=Triparma columacea TaxID=722753 RepID=A0A9W7GE21_9STRA|nr:hypothetical protein TrCOL_g3709 [Triparma columacea]
MITPGDVLEFRKPAENFLCPLSANCYGIDFLQFQINDYETKKIIFEVGKDIPPVNMEMDIDFGNMEDSFRKIKYTFSEDVLRLPLIGTSLVFKVGDKPLEDFRMIERHYFRNKLVKSYDFTFGFCIPGSTNTWDTVYSLPPLEDDLISEMVSSPYETTSDSFYFVGDTLVMHNKASYRYKLEDGAQDKRSYDTDYEAKNSRLTAKGTAQGDSKMVDSENKQADSKMGDSDDEGPWSKNADYD